MQQPFKLRPSRYLASILAIAHAIALAALIPLVLSGWAKFMLGLAILYSAWRCLRRDAWFFASSSSAVLDLESEGTVLLKRNGESLAGRVRPSSVVTPYMVVLNIAPEDARLARSVIILPDSLDAESFRQLRVRLKWGMWRQGAGASAYPGYS